MRKINRDGTRAKGTLSRLSTMIQRQLSNGSEDDDDLQVSECQQVSWPRAGNQQGGPQVNKRGERRRQRGRERDNNKLW